MCIHIYIHTYFICSKTVPVFCGVHFRVTSPRPQRLKPNRFAVGNMYVYNYIYILYLYVHTHTVYPSSNSGKHPRNMFVDRNTNMQPYIQKNHIYNFDYDHLYTWFLKTAENDRVITVFCAMSLDSQPLQVQCALCPITTILPSLGFTMWNAAAESPMNLQSPSTNMKCQSPCGFVPQDPRVSHQFLSYDGHALGW